MQKAGPSQLHIDCKGKTGSVTLWIVIMEGRLWTLLEGQNAGHTSENHPISDSEKVVDGALEDLIAVQVDEFRHLDN
jgi:hypothetical protein